MILIVFFLLWSGVITVLNYLVWALYWAKDRETLFQVADKIAADYDQLYSDHQKAVKMLQMVANGDARH